MDHGNNLSPERVESIFQYLPDESNSKGADPPPVEAPVSRSERARVAVADALVGSASGRASATLEVVRREWALALAHTRTGNISGRDVRRSLSLASSAAPFRSMP